MNNALLDQIISAHNTANTKLLMDTVEELKGGGWISVEDRLPDEEGIYIIFEPNSHGSDVDADYFNCGFSVAATHWMPLPPPPNATDGTISD